MTKRCIITGNIITPENDSRAHVIPSALGGRLKPLGILSRDANALLGDKIDLPLIQAFQSLMNLVNGSRDRGQNTPTRVTDESGKTYVFEFGEPLSLAAPEYHAATIDGVTMISIKARTLKEVRTLLGRVKAKDIAFDIDEAVRCAVVEHQWPDGMLQHKLQIGPAVVFPALFVAASVFACSFGQLPHPKLGSYVSAFDPERPPMPPDTFYFMPPKNWITNPAMISHVITFVGDNSRKQAMVYLELFNIACVGVILPFNGSSDTVETYAVDVLTGDEIQVQIDEAIIRSTPWTATHHLGDAALFSFFEQRVGAAMEIAWKRHWDANIEKITRRGLGSIDGRPLMPQDCANLVKESVEFIKNWWKNPIFTPEIRRADLPHFESLCAYLEGLLPTFCHSQFRNLIEPFTADLVRAAELQ